MKTIFIVDDNDTNLAAAKTALDGVYRTFALPSAAKMFKLAEKILPDLILLDVEMPDVGGFAAMAMLKESARLQRVPVIFLTAHQDAETEIRGFEMGALDFINKPFSAPVLIKRIEFHIETDRLIKASQQAVRDIHNATISVLANMVESRDKVTGEHIERTQSYLEVLLRALSRSGTYAGILSQWDADLLLPSAQLHDVGKITINDAILNKAGKLTDEEFALIKTHTTEGERIIDRIISKTGNDDFLRHAKLFAGYHHERWDGTGYPYRVAGESIPLQGRIMAVVDVYDALTSERPYKKAMPHDEAVGIIRQGGGGHFDPALVAVFLECAEEFRAAPRHEVG